MVRASWLVNRCVFMAAMNHKNNVSDMSGFLQFVRIYSFMTEMILYILHICASYNVFLFVKSENNIFIK